MHSPFDCVGEGVMFSGCPSPAFVRFSVRSFVRPDTFVTMISHEWLEQCRWNLLGILNSPNDDLSRLWRSKVKGKGHSRPSRWRRHLRLRPSVDVHLLVYYTFSSFFSKLKCNFGLGTFVADPGFCGHRRLSGRSGSNCHDPLRALRFTASAGRPMSNCWHL